jgi:hypothetical protein
MLNDHEIDIEDEPETLLEDTKENAPDEEDEDEKEAAVLVAADRLLDANNVASQAVMDAAAQQYAGGAWLYGRMATFGRNIEGNEDWGM